MPVFRVIVFFIILFLLVSTAQYYLQYRERYKDNSSFQVINFYKEKKDSVDAVFVGSSITFSYYSPLLAYNSYGIKTTNYASSGMGMLAYRYAIEEVRKYQKDALIVLTVTPNYQMQYLGVHFMSDYMPFSKNKIQFLTKYFTQDGESILNSLGFYATLMEYHDRWSEMDKDDFIIDEGIKGATRHQYYLSTINDISDNVVTTTDKETMPEKMEEFMVDLLDYCDEKEEKNIVFLYAPKAYSLEEYAQFNTLAQLITSRGYRLLDLRDSFDDIGLIKNLDYYDLNHTNIHGSIKYTSYLANYIMANRKCDVVNDEQWNKAVNKYKNIINDYVLDVEFDMNGRDFFLEKPELLSIEQNGNSVVLKWKEVENANGYIVYRKSDGGFKDVSGKMTGNYFEDNDVEDNQNYTYTVISYKSNNNKMLYGNYDYKGLSIEVKK